MRKTNFQAELSNETVGEAQGSGRRGLAAKAEFFFNFLSFFFLFWLPTTIWDLQKLVCESSKCSELLTYLLVGHVQNLCCFTHWAAAEPDGLAFFEEKMVSLQNHLTNVVNRVAHKGWSRRGLGPRRPCRYTRMRKLCMLFILYMIYLLTFNWFGMTTDGARLSIHESHPCNKENSPRSGRNLVS